MKLLNRTLMLFVGLILTSTLVSAGGEACDVELGEKVYKKCTACHTNDDTSAHLVGPNLYGIVNTMSGVGVDFPYSVAMLEAPRKWTPEALDEFLEAPMTILPGTAMAFAGIRKPHQRAAVICYINAGETL